MSKFSKLIETIDTGHRTPLNEPKSNLSRILDAKEQLGHSVQHVGKVYQLDVRISQRVILQDDASESKEEIIKNTRAFMVDAMFGEFREDLALLRQQIYNHEMEEANTTLSRIQRNMFEV